MLAIVIVIGLAMSFPLPARSHTPSIEFNIKAEGARFILYVTPVEDLLKAVFNERGVELCSDSTPEDGLTCDVTATLQDKESHDFIVEVTARDGDRNSSVITVQLSAAGTLLAGEAAECAVSGLKAGVFPKRIEISGRCPAGSEIEITVLSDPITRSTVADESGRFIISVTEPIGAGLHTVNGTYQGGEISSAMPETLFCVGTKDECVALGYDGNLVVEEPGKLANRVYTFIVITAILLAASVIMALRRIKIGAGP